MDAVTIMTAVNNLNMVTTLNMLAVQNEDAFIVTENGKECEIMSGSILDAYIGKDCVVSLFNDVGGIKGKLMDADAQWVKIETPKRGHRSSIVTLSAVLILRISSIVSEAIFVGV